MDFGSRRVSGRKHHDQPGGDEASEPLRPAEPAHARKGNPAVADHVDGLGDDRDEDDADRDPRGSERDPKDHVDDHRLGQPVGQGVTDRDRIPPPRRIDSGPRRRTREAVPCHPDQAQWGERDQGQGEERREQPCRRSRASRVHRINLLTSPVDGEDGEPEVRGARSWQRLRPRRPSAGHGSTRRTDLE